MLLGTRTKTEKDSKNRIWTLLECSCRVCNSCWYYIEKGHCIYNGPFCGYAVIEDKPPFEKIIEIK